MWQGTLEPELAPLPVWAELGEDTSSMVTSVSAELRKLVDQLDKTTQAYERRLAAEMGSRAALATSERKADQKEEGREIAKALLPSLDALDRIIEFGDGFEARDEVFDNWLASVKAMRVRLKRTLEGMGLMALSSVGMQVDLELHDVVAMVPAAGDYLPNTVVAEQQKGYYYKGKLLRDAKVVVAQ